MDEYEIVTVYYGDQATEDGATSLAEHIEASYPDVEVEVLNGGQAHYYYIISVE